jgi:hypothetical protein
MSKVFGVRALSGKETASCWSDTELKEMVIQVAKKTKNESYVFKDFRKRPERKSTRRSKKPIKYNADKPRSVQALTITSARPVFMDTTSSSETEEGSKAPVSKPNPGKPKKRKSSDKEVPLPIPKKHKTAPTKKNPPKREIENIVKMALNQMQQSQQSSDYDQSLAALVKGQTKTQKQVSDLVKVASSLRNQPVSMTDLELSMEARLARAEEKEKKRIEEERKHMEKKFAADRKREEDLNSQLVELRQAQLQQEKDKLNMMLMMQERNNQQQMMMYQQQQQQLNSERNFQRVKTLNEQKVDIGDM